MPWRGICHPEFIRIVIPPAVVNLEDSDRLQGHGQSHICHFMGNKLSATIKI